MPAYIHLTPVHTYVKVDALPHLHRRLACLHPTVLGCAELHTWRLNSHELIASVKLRAGPDTVGGTASSADLVAGATAVLRSYGITNACIEVDRDKGPASPSKPLPAQDGGGGSAAGAGVGGLRSAASAPGIGGAGSRAEWVFRQLEQEERQHVVAGFGLAPRQGGEEEVSVARDDGAKGRGSAEIHAPMQ